MNSKFDQMAERVAANKALFGGYFVQHVQDKLLFKKNTMVKYGAQQMLMATFQNAATLAATWYLGLTSAAYTFDQANLLTALAAGEPTNGSYARLAIARSGAGWTVSESNGVMMAVSAAVTFAATANWNVNWSRAFLCDAAAGTAGNVISVSGPTPNPVSTLSGAPPTWQYVYYLRG